MKYKVWLERARGSPLDIFIGFQPFKGASVKHAKSIMRLIMPHVSHWRSFRVDHVPKKISRLIFDRLRDVSAPMLEVLKVFGERHRRVFQGPTTTKCQLKPFVHGEASNLTELTVVGFPHDYFLNRFTSLQALQLTQFYFFGAGTIENVKSLQHILVSLPNLHTLHIDCDRPIMQNPRPSIPLVTLPPRICHPSLTELWIYLPKADHDAILSSLDLPRVRYFLTRMQVELALGLHLLPPLSQYHPFSSLVSLRLAGSHFGYALGGLTMGFGSVDRSSQMNLIHLEGALAGLPLLKALTFDQVHFEDGKWLRCLGMTCPRLHWLTFNQCGGCTLEQIRAIVEARRKRQGFDALVRLIIEQWPAGGFITIDQGADEWLKRSLIYEFAHTADGLTRESYLSAVEELKASRSLIGINPRSSRR
ncbi:hypothetical protein M407DRAFT_29548 [Tulasnella calospora MUT 4182]|uniref:F-box domain-containing protein n=1 Tax=Tulasnella calospora MUT 4182 TaxID=1051891 RepID=A0A0C3PZD6_9AGAM|nr:hypothetical protein M407DRAFT_29548 [Tulasnella calospora MUT 4182]